MKKRFDWKILAGLLISVVFLYLSFRKVDFRQMLDAFAQANYWYLLPMILIIFLSHLLRAWRWQFLLLPIKSVRVLRLLSALLIGYMANSFLPAHLGEFIRAYLIHQKEQLDGSAVFGTIVIERIIDVFALLLLMALALIVYPELPDIARQGGYIMVAGVITLLGVLLIMKRFRRQSLVLVDRLTQPLSETARQKTSKLFASFLDGIVPLQSASHYAIVGVLSILLWACYGAVFQLAFYSFGFVNTFALPWTAALVLLVTTTIAVVVPSSPGYIGTYHFLCMLALQQFGVPQSEALTYAFVVHGINFLPLIVVGMVIVSFEGLSLKQVKEKAVHEGVE